MRWMKYPATVATWWMAVTFAAACGRHTPLPGGLLDGATPASGGISGGGSGGASGAGGAGAAGGPDGRADAPASDGPVPARDGGVVPGPPDRPPMGTDPCGAMTPLGRSPLRRLTNAQYRRTVRDLLGVTDLSVILPDEPTRLGFEDRAELQSVTPELVAQWNRAAAEVAPSAVARLPALVPCPIATVDEPCARRFIEVFGRRAYRRPLTPAERDRYLSLFRSVRMLGEPADAIEAVLQAFLQSPYLLHRPEVLGRTAFGGSGRLALHPSELATRLSYLFWGTMPDEPLLAAADAAQLGTPAQLEAQARRLLSDPRAREGVRDFFRQWLSIDQVLGEARDPMVYPRWNQQLARSMSEEGHRFVEYVMFQGDGKLSTLFTARETFVDAALAAIYGLRPGAPGWQRVALDPSQRAGLLTQGWFLAGNGAVDNSHPVRRGMHVRERLLCQPVPPPPAGIDTTLPPLRGGTNRMRYEQHRTNPACASCHHLIDPIGFLFERYDGTGAFRTAENGHPIDDSGTLMGAGPGLEGPFKGALELAVVIGQSRPVGACLGQRWYEQAHGRDASFPPDACRLDVLASAMDRSGGDVRELMISVVQTDSFSTRSTEGLSTFTIVQTAFPDPTAARSAAQAVLDVVRAELAQLSARFAGGPDRARLDQHLAGVRELERRLAMP
jgi:hypothetical protein